MNRGHSVLAALSLILLASLAIQVIPIISAPPVHPGIPPHHPVPPRPRSSPGHGGNSHIDPFTLPSSIVGTYYKSFYGASVVVRGTTVLYAYLGSSETAITFTNARSIVFDNVVIVVKEYNMGVQDVSNIIKLDDIGVVKGSITIKIEGPIESSTQGFNGDILNMIYFDGGVSQVDMNTIRIVFSPSEMICWTGNNVALYVYGIYRQHTGYGSRSDYIGNIYTSVNLGKNNSQNFYLRGLYVLETEDYETTNDNEFHGFLATFNVNNLVISSFTSHTNLLSTALAGVYVAGYGVNINNFVIKDIYVDNPRGRLLVVGAQVDSWNGYPYSGVNIGNIIYSNFKGKLAIFDYYFFILKPDGLQAFIHYDRAYINGIDIRASYLGSSGIIDDHTLYAMTQADRYPSYFSNIIFNFTIGSSIRTFGTYLETAKDARTGTTGGLKSINLFLLAIPSGNTFLQYTVGPYQINRVPLKPGSTIIVEARMRFEKPNPYQIVLIGRNAVSLSLHDPLYHNSITLIVNGKVMHVSGVSFGMLQGIAIGRGIASLSDGRSIPLLSMPGMIAGFTSNRI